MKTVNLHSTLSAYNEINPNLNEQLVLKEAEAILKNSAKKDLEVLKKLGMDNSLIVHEEITAYNAKISKFDEVYDIKAIKKLAVNYRLRFLPSNLYKGTIDPQLPAILNKFIADKKLYGDNDKFYILAPASSFKLQERPKDPLIFYKISDDKYAFIHKWGNDLNKSRLWKYFLIRNFLCEFFLCISIPVFVYFLCKEITESTTVSGVFAFLSFSFLFGLFNETNLSSEDNWDSEYL